MKDTLHKVGIRRCWLAGWMDAVRYMMACPVRVQHLSQLLHTDGGFTREHRSIAHAVSISAFIAALYHAAWHHGKRQTHTRSSLGLASSLSHPMYASSLLDAWNVRLQISHLSALYHIPYSEFRILLWNPEGCSTVGKSFSGIGHVQMQMCLNDFSL